MRLLLQELSGVELSSIEVESGVSLADLRSATRASLSLDQEINFCLLIGERELHEDIGDLPFALLGVEDGAILVVVKRPAIQVLTTSEDGTAKIWNSSTGDCLLTLAGHAGSAISAMFFG